MTKPDPRLLRASHLLWQGNAGNSWSSHVRPQRIVAILHRNEEQRSSIGGPKPPTRDRVAFIVEVQEPDAMGDLHWHTGDSMADAAAMALVGYMLEDAGVPAWLKDWYHAQGDRPVHQP